MADLVMPLGHILFLSWLTSLPSLLKWTHISDNSHNQINSVNLATKITISEYAKIWLHVLDTNDTKKNHTVMMM